MDGKEIKSAKLITKNFMLIIAINLLIFFGFQMLMPAFPLYVNKLGGDDSMIGVVAGCFTGSSLVARILSGRALDRFGRKVIFLSGLAVFIVAVFAYNWIPTIGLILVFRLIHGFGWGASSTASNTIASDNIPAERFGEGMGYFSLASSLPMAIAPAAGLFLASQYSINIVIIVSGSMAALGFILSLLIQYKKPEKYEKPKTRTPFFEKNSIPSAIVMLFIAATYGSIVSFMPLYAAEQGIENPGWFFSVYAIALLVSRPAFGRISDRKGFKYATVPGLVSVLITMLLLSRASNLPILLLAAFFYGIGIGGVMSSLQAMSLVRSPENRRGAANATFFMGFDIGSGVGAMAFGAIASAVGYSYMYLSAVISVVLAFVFFFTLANKKEAVKLK